MILRIKSMPRSFPRNKGTPTIYSTGNRRSPVSVRGDMPASMQAVTAHLIRSGRLNGGFYVHSSHIDMFAFIRERSPSPAHIRTAARVSQTNVR